MEPVVVMVIGDGGVAMETMDWGLEWGWGKELMVPCDWELR